MQVTKFNKIRAISPANIFNSPERNYVKLSKKSETTKNQSYTSLMDLKTYYFPLTPKYSRKEETYINIIDKSNDSQIKDKLSTNDLHLPIRIQKYSPIINYHQRSPELVIKLSTDSVIKDDLRLNEQRFLAKVLFTNKTKSIKRQNDCSNSASDFIFDPSEIVSSSRVETPSYEIAVQDFSNQSKYSSTNVKKTQIKRVTSSQIKGLKLDLFKSSQVKTASISFRDESSEKSCCRFSPSYIDSLELAKMSPKLKTPTNRDSCSSYSLKRKSSQKFRNQELIVNKLFKCKGTVQ